jgi:transcriptional regulator with XRE-family HTH domain
MLQEVYSQAGIQPGLVYRMSESVRLNGAVGSHRREALAEFLRTRRERLSPEDVGLPSGGRRRTPGLRREEVALLANVGISWYTSLEQGRRAKPSDQVLEGIAGALKLSPEEQWHLFVLADRKPPPCIPPSVEKISSALRRVLDDLRASPAYAISAHGDLAYWNAAAEAIFGLSSSVPPHERNLLWQLFVNPSARERYTSWEAIAQTMLARFRAEFARHPSDPRFASLIEDLQRESSEFREWWPRYDVAGEADGRQEIIHPDAGRVVLEHVTLSPPGDPDLKMVVYTPASVGDAARLTGALQEGTKQSFDSGNGNGGQRPPLV